MTMRLFFSALLLLTLATLAPGCGVERPETDLESGSGGGTVSGQVIKGRVAGATLNVFRVLAAERGPLVATGTTAEDGSFTVPVSASEGPFLVVATGGSFVDEASGATIRLNGDELTALVPTFRAGTQLQGLLVTPISHFAAGLALREVRAGTAGLAGADAMAWQQLNAHFGGLDWRRTVPTDVTQSSLSQVDDSAKAGLILAGLSQEASTIAQKGGLTPGGSVNALSLTSALYEDALADGHFDGLGVGGQRILLLSGGSAPSSLEGTAVRSALAEGIADFLSNPRNAYRVGRADVQPLLRVLSTGTSAYLFGDAAAGEQTPPSVALSGTVPRYTSADRVSFTVVATAASPISAVRALRVGKAGVFTAQEQRSPEGERLFSFQEVPLDSGLNTLQVWAESADHPAPAQNPLVLPISRDNVAPWPTIEQFPAYRDERSMDFQRSGDGAPAAPLVYTWPANVGRGHALGEVYKASTRLSWGPKPPTGADLEGDNSYNVPFLSFSSRRNVESEAPVTRATYSVRVECEGCNFPPATGQLIASPRSTQENAAFLLPLSQESIPALASLPTSPAKLAVSVAFEDGAGNTGMLTASVNFHVVGAPVAVVEDTQYAARQDPNSEYGYSLARGTYPGMWGGQGNVRIVRYVLHNPAPLPVVVNVGTSGSWSLSEKWHTVLAPPQDATFTADGMTLSRTYNWVYYLTSGPGAPRARPGELGPPCAGGPGYSSFPVHHAGASSAFGCDPLPLPSEGFLAEPTTAGRLGHAVYLPASGAFEQELAPSSPFEGGSGEGLTDTYVLPPHGQLTLFLVRPRKEPLSSYEWVDLRNGRGPRIQTWQRDVWRAIIGPFECNANGRQAMCYEYAALRESAELAQVRSSMAGSLAIATGSGSEVELRFALEGDQRRDVTY